MNYRDHPEIETRFSSNLALQQRVSHPLTTSGAQNKSASPTTQLITPGVTDSESAPSEAPEMPMVITGYAALYNSAVSYGGWVEYLVPGCFKETLTAEDCLSSWNHNVDCILGRCSAGTLQLADDVQGLAYECELPNHMYGQYVGVGIQRKDIQGLSIMFMVEDEDWDTDKEPYTRLIKKVRLFECGPVWSAANPECKVSLRAQKFVAEKRAAKQRKDAELRREYQPLDDLELRCRLLAL